MARFGTSSMGMPPKISFTTRPFLGESCAFTAAASGEPVRSRWTATRYCNKDRKQGLERKLGFFLGLSLSRILVQVLLSGALVGTCTSGAHRARWLAEREFPYATRGRTRSLCALAQRQFSVAGTSAGTYASGVERI